MRFKIDCASSSQPDFRPCDEAVRSRDGGCWVIDFDTLEDLTAFLAEHNSLILSDYSSEDGHGELPRMTIYDDYVE